MIEFLGVVVPPYVVHIRMGDFESYSKLAAFFPPPSPWVTSFTCCHFQSCRSSCFLHDGATTFDISEAVISIKSFLTYIACRPADDFLLSIDVLSDPFFLGPPNPSPPELRFGLSLVLFPERLTPRFRKPFSLHFLFGLRLGPRRRRPPDANQHSFLFCIAYAAGFPPLGIHLVFLVPQ